MKNILGLKEGEILCPTCSGKKEITVPCGLCDQTGRISSVPFMMCETCFRLFSCPFIRRGRCKQPEYNYGHNQNPRFEEVKIIEDKRISTRRIGVCICHKCSASEWDKCATRFVTSKGKLKTK